MRSCLFLQQLSGDPAALSGGAGAAVLDLSSVDAFDAGLAWLRRTRDIGVSARVFVKTPPMEEGVFFDLLKRLEPLPPHGFLLDAVESGAQAQRLSARLAVFEAEAGLEDGAMRVLVEISTPAGALSLSHFGPRPPRIAAFLFGGAKLAGRLGVETGAAPVLQARAEVVLLAAASGLPALDDFCLAPAALEADCLAARRDGFAGKCATRPEEIATIEAVFAGAAADKTPQSAAYLRA